MALFARKVTSAKIRERIARLEAQLPELERAAVDASVAYVEAEDPDRQAYLSARAAVTDCHAEIELLERQLSRVEAEEAAEREAAEEAAAAKVRQQKQNDLNRLTVQAQKQALDLSAKIANVLSAKARLAETIKSLNAITNVGLSAAYDLPGLFEAEEKAIREGTTSWETGKPYSPLVQRFDRLVADSKDLIERRHQADADYEPRKGWSGRQELGMETHAEGGMPWVPSHDGHGPVRQPPAPQPSNFSWPPPSPKQNVIAGGVRPSDDQAAAPSAAYEPAASGQSPERDGAAADPVDDDEPPAEGLDNPEFQALLRRDVIREEI
jgi:hypothetical protein